MRRIYVPLHEGDLAILARLAEDERRHPSDEASLILSRGIRAKLVRALGAAAGPHQGEGQAPPPEAPDAA